LFAESILKSFADLPEHAGVIGDALAHHAQTGGQSAGGVAQRKRVGELGMKYSLPGAGESKVAQVEILRVFGSDFTDEGKSPALVNWISAPAKSENFVEVSPNLESGKPTTRFSPSISKRS